MSKNVERSEELKVKILTVIGRFGWLRIREISKIVWPEADKKNAFKYADGHLRRLEKDGYLKLEKLPEYTGTAATLHGKAIRFLKAEGIEVTKVSFNPHEPGSEWKHDLLTTSLFALLINNTEYCPKDAKYNTDRECKRVEKESTNEVRDYNGKIKVPDLLLQTVKWGAIALEVERSQKTGSKNKDPLIRTLILTNTQKAPYKFGDLTPNLVVLAYDPDQKIIRNGKPHRVNHGKNIFNSVSKQMSLFKIEKKIRVITFKMKVEKYAAVEVWDDDHYMDRHEIKAFFNPSDIGNFDPTL